MRREAAPIDSLGFVIVCLALATAARWGISQIRADVPFSLNDPAVLLTAVFGGLRLGLLAAVFGAVLGTAVDLADAPTGPARIALLAIYVIVSGLILWAARHYRFGGQTIPWQRTDRLPSGRSSLHHQLQDTGAE